MKLMNAMTSKKLHGSATTIIFFSSVASSEDTESFVTQKKIMLSSKATTKIIWKGPFLKYLKTHELQLEKSKQKFTYVC